MCKCSAGGWAINNQLHLTHSEWLAHSGRGWKKHSRVPKVVKLDKSTFCYIIAMYNCIGIGTHN